MVILNVNADAVIRFTATLERLSKSALPVAVRTSLNSAAFDVKTDTMPIAADVFVHRSPTFFKATSKVAPAKGFDINEMHSTVGFMPQSGAKESGGATKDLEQQEDSGTIEHRTFVPLAAARAGGSFNRNVSPKNRLKAIKDKIKDAKDSAGATDAAKFFSTAMFVGKGGFVIAGKNKRMLVRINSIHREGGKTFVNSTALYSVKSGRQVKPKATHFMRIASLQSAKKIEGYYILAAQKQLAKLGG